MKCNISIGEGIYMISAEDRRTQLFENIWPLPYGVSYNSYLIVDEKTVLLDTVESGSEDNYIAYVESLLDGRNLDYLIINHMEPDHTGEVDSVLNRWPDVRIVGNKQTFKIMNNYYDVDAKNILEIGDGDTLPLGRHTLKFILTPWVHWPETMMTYEVSEQILFSGDAFGTFGATNGAVLDDISDLADYEDEMRRYYSNIIGKYGAMVQKAFAKLAAVSVNTICSLHGPVWRGRAKDVMALYDKWSRNEAGDNVVILYASMYGNTANMANYIAHGLACRGVEGVKVYDVSKTHLSYLISEVWRCKYIVLGSCSYNGGMFPLMEMFCSMMKHQGIKNRCLSIFGSGSWSGGGMKALAGFAAESGWEQVCEPVEIIGNSRLKSLEILDSISSAVAERVSGKH